MDDFKAGDRVTWRWGSGVATGKVTKRYTSKVTRTLKGSEVTRNGSEDAPAFLIEQEDGDEALKSGSELEKG